MFKHILVPLDGTELCKKAIQQAIPIAKENGARITALHVRPGHHYYLSVENGGFAVPEIPALKRRIEEEDAARANEILGELKEAAAQAGVACDAVAVTGDEPSEKIIEEANKSHCDLILMVTHGRKGLTGALLGSETTKVLKHSNVPVLVYH